jgi:Domain of unknown function (DUF4340)
MTGVITTSRSIFFDKTFLNLHSPPTTMKFKKSTVLLFASALVLGTSIFIYEVTIAPQMEANKLERQKVFDFEMAQVKSLTLETPERTLEFIRVQSQPESAEPKWEMKVLESSTKSELNDRNSIQANEAYVSFLISLLVNAQSDRQIPLSADRKVEYGLDKPQATIDFTLKNDKRYKLVLGKRDFSDNFLYAIANPPDDANAKLSAILLPINFENGINRPLSEWKAETETTEQTKPKIDKKTDTATTEEKTATPEPTSDSTSEEPSPDSAKPNVENLDTSTPETPSEKTEPEKTEPEKIEPEKVNGEASTPSPEPQKVEEPSDANAPPKEEGTTSPEQTKPENSQSTPSKNEEDSQVRQLQ